MKNFTTISTYVLIAVVLLLVFKVFSGNQKPHSTNGDGVISTKSGSLNLAYINTDSLLAKYEYAKDLNESFIQKQEGSRVNLNEKARVLQTEMAEFNRKLQNNGFLSRERAESENQRLVGKQRELQELDGQLSQELLDRQRQISKELLDTITNVLRDFNYNGKYEMILNNTLGGVVLHSKKGYDITAEVLDVLNKRYKNGQK